MAVKRFVVDDCRERFRRGLTECENGVCPIVVSVGGVNDGPISRWLDAVASLGFSVPETNTMKCVPPFSHHPQK